MLVHIYLTGVLAMYLLMGFVEVEPVSPVQSLRSNETLHVVGAFILAWLSWLLLVLAIIIGYHIHRGKVPPSNK